MNKGESEPAPEDALLFHWLQRNAALDSLGEHIVTGKEMSSPPHALLSPNSPHARPVAQRHPTHRILEGVNATNSNVNNEPC